MKRKLKVPTFSGHKLDGWDKIHGLDISIENARGTFRKGTDPDGNEWSRFMFHDYGYIKLTKGADGDHVDVYIGPDRLSEKAYVIHQLDPETGAYDEDKVFMGFRRAEDARRAFYWQYDHPTKFYGSMDTYDIDEFKQLLKDRIGVKLKKSLHKAKRMPVGTVSKGRKKVAEGKWRPVKTDRKGSSSLPKAEDLNVHDSRAQVKASLPKGEAEATKGTEYEKHGDLEKTDYKVSGGPIYRGVTLEDYKRIREQGYVDSDMRGAISKSEGMNLTTRPGTAIEYIPSDKKGVVLAIDPSKLNLWGIKSDDYIRTSDKIPKDAIQGVSDVMDKAAESKGFEISQGARRVSFYLAGYEMLDEAGYPKKAREWRERAKKDMEKQFPNDSDAQKKALERGLKDKKVKDEYKNYLDLDDIVEKSKRETNMIMATTLKGNKLRKAKKDGKVTLYKSLPEKQGKVKRND